MRVLAIETSCDETSVAIYSEQGLEAHEIHSQIDLHAVYGGVIPELAARDHLTRLLPMVQLTLQKANLSLKDILAFGYTKGPGLMGALMVGASFTRSLAYAEQKPCIGVHHLEAHILASFLSDPKPTWPFLALLVSGGHTLLIEAQALGKYRVLGESIDDAVGEAFDKTAKLLGLPYPGGAALSQLSNQGIANRFNFPRPLLDRPGMDFSFSGLKTAARNVIRTQESDNTLDAQTKADIAFAFQEAVVDTLVEKCRRALIETGLTQLVIAGGVAANQRLRQRLLDLNIQLIAPPSIFCTDNAAMVAITAYQQLLVGHSDSLVIQAIAREPL